MAESLGSVLYEQHGRGWHVSIYCRWPGDRRKRRHRIRATCEKEANKILNRIRGKVANGVPLHTALTPYLADYTSSSAFVTRWEDHCKELDRDVAAGQLHEDRPYELRRYVHRGYLDFFSTVPLLSINDKTMIGYVRDLRERKTKSGKPLGPKTVKNVVHDVGSFLRWLKQEGDIMTAPEVPTIKVPDYQPNPPTEETLRQVLECVPESEVGLFLARSLLGLRPAEARRLQVRDVIRGKSKDLSDAYVRLPSHSTKTKRGRDLALHPEVAAWLVKHGNLDKRFGNEPLFTNPRGRFPDKRWIEDAESGVLRRAEIAAGVAHTKPNEAGRHFYGTEAANRGLDVYLLKHLMGHSSIESTQRYAKMRPVPIARVLGQQSTKR